MKLFKTLGEAIDHATRQARGQNATYYICETCGMFGVSSFEPSVPIHTTIKP